METQTLVCLEASVNDSTKLFIGHSGNIIDRIDHKLDAVYDTLQECFS